MKRALLFLALCLSLAAPSLAGTGVCNATLAAQNVCPAATGWVRYCLAISTTDPDGAGARVAPSVEVADAFAAQAAWTGTATCTNGSGGGPNMVAAGICTAPQVGTVVPITRAQNADLWIREYVVSVVRWHRQQLAVAAAQASARATADPDLGQ